jgi:hypothetical protein
LVGIKIQACCGHWSAASVSSANMPIAGLPSSIDSFLGAIRAGDAFAVMSALGGATVLVDSGGEYRGPAIRPWVDSLCACQAPTVRSVAEEVNHGEVALIMLVGNDLHDWRFRLEAERIVALRITPHQMPQLAAPVAAYIRATNKGDLEALLATFVDDALVNDQLRDYWGREQIRNWAQRDIIGEQLTMRVVGVVLHHGHVIVIAHVNGDFDKRGLPDPLVLTFYFSAVDDRIVQLIILRNQSGT